MSEYCEASHEECGRHSGIPPCCREWYQRVWLRVFSEFMDIYESGRPGVEFTYELEGDDTFDFIEYIRCPGCRATGAYVRIKPCPGM
jgi:hypothetical protein